MDVFMLRMQQLSSISIIESIKVLPAFKIFFNVLQGSVSCQVRYVKYLVKDLENNFVFLIQDECEKLAVNRTIYANSV